MNVNVTQSFGGANFNGVQRASGNQAESPAPAQGETFTQTQEEEPSRLQSAWTGAKVGFLASTAVGVGLSILTMGALAPVAILAVPICTALGAYVGAVNPRFES
ncbi:MAG: hypothetical protein AMXMBFR33_54720 [Candidatus Xenobia bacterium]